MKLKKNKSLKALAVTVLLSCSAPSHALLPTTDFAVLAETMMGNFQALAAWMEEKQMMFTGMDLDKELSQLEMDNLNNAVTNEIVRTINAEQNMHNLDLTEKTRPSKNACVTVALSAVDKGDDCDISMMKKEMAIKARTKAANFNKGAGEIQKDNKEKIEKIVNECEGLQDSNAPLDAENPMGSSLCMDAGLLLGTTSGLTRSPDEEKAVNHMIEILLGPRETQKRSQRLASSDSKKDAQLHESRLIIFKDFVRNSITEATMSRTSPSSDPNQPKPSELYVIETTINQHYDANSLMQTNNADAKSKNEGTEENDTTLKRNAASLEAVRAKLQLLQYKHQLRMEVLQASLLELEIEPIVRR